VQSQSDQLIAINWALPIKIEHYITGKNRCKVKSTSQIEQLIAANCALSIKIEQMQNRAKIFVLFSPRRTPPSKSLPSSPARRGSWKSRWRRTRTKRRRPAATASRKEAELQIRYAAAGLTSEASFYNKNLPLGEHSPLGVKTLLFRMMEVRTEDLHP
jgi:hypothetical protein